MLLSVKDNKVYLQMGGGCQGCEASDITLKAGIERMIKEEIPEIHEVLGTTDHSEYRYEPELGSQGRSSIRGGGPGSVAGKHQCMKTPIQLVLLRYVFIDLNPV